MSGRRTIDSVGVGRDGATSGREDAMRRGGDEMKKVKRDQEFPMSVKDRAGDDSGPLATMCLSRSSTDVGRWRKEMNPRSKWGRGSAKKSGELFFLINQRRHTASWDANPVTLRINHHPPAALFVPSPPPCQCPCCLGHSLAPRGYSLPPSFPPALEKKGKKSDKIERVSPRIHR